MDKTPNRRGFDFFDLAFDFVGYIFNFLYWYSISFLPLIIILLLFVGVGVNGVTIIVSLFLVVCTALVGLILRWLSKGLLNRYKGRTVLAILFTFAASFVLALMAALYALLLTTGEAPQFIVGALIQYSIYALSAFTAGAILLVGFLKGRNQYAGGNNG